MQQAKSQRLSNSLHFGVFSAEEALGEFQAKYEGS
jgi:hypothetical protein